MRRLVAFRNAQSHALRAPGKARPVAPNGGPRQNQHRLRHACRISRERNMHIRLRVRERIKKNAGCVAFDVEWTFIRFFPHHAL